jgi:hypothetical protein
MPERLCESLPEPQGARRLPGRVSPPRLLCRKDRAASSASCIASRTRSSYEKAAFAEPVSIALHAVNLADGIEVGEAFTEPRVKSTADEDANHCGHGCSCDGEEAPGGTAVVVGAGLIGLLVIQALKARGWDRVIAVDLDEKRLELAKKLGARPRPSTPNKKGSPPTSARSAVAMAQTPASKSSVLLHRWISPSAACAKAGRSSSSAISSPTHLSRSKKSSHASSPSKVPAPARASIPRPSAASRTAASRWSRCSAP